MSNFSSRRSQRKYSGNFLGQLIHNYPIACLSGVWLSVVLTAAIGFAGLMHPGSETGEYLPTPTSNSPTNLKKPAQKNTLPLLLFGAVIFGCATGSLLVTSAKSTRHKSIRRSRSKSRRMSNCSRKFQPTWLNQVMVKKRHKHKVLKTKGNSFFPSSESTEKEPIVTVVPAEESIPLDRREPSIAEIMDWRKRHSLSSLIGDL